MTYRPRILSHGDLLEHERSQSHHAACDNGMVYILRDDKQVRLLLEAETPVVTIFGKTWLLHVREVLQTTPEENLAMVGDTVRHLKQHGKFVIYDAEHGFDGYKDDPAYALATFDVCRLYATVFEWNPASARILEKAGYVLEGRLRKSVIKDGQTIDQLLFAYVRE